MAARTLWFRGTQIAAGLVKVEPAAAPQTPPGIQSALFQDAAEVISDSRNVLYALEVSVHLKEADEIEFAETAMALQEYAGLTGLMQIKEGSTVKVDWDGCTLMRAPQVGVAEGFGGRFTPAWVFSFVGASRPEFP